jgi:acetyl esterase/lipase
MPFYQLYAPLWVALCLSGACLGIASAKAAPTAPPVLPAGITLQKDMDYLEPGRTETLDLYLPADRPSGTRSPGIVFIHGGGWTGGSKSDSRAFNVCTTLAGAGYVCVSIDYRLTKHDRWPTNIYDCKNGVRFLRFYADKYGVDTSHIGVIGGSAGGHLALMVGMTDDVPALEPPAPYPGVSDRVQAIVDMYGISDIRTRKIISHDGTPGEIAPLSNTVFGDKTNVTDADRALASPVTHISASTPPILILHGTHDTTVDRDQSITLDKLLAAQHVPHQFVLITGVGHTFTLEQWYHKPLPFDLRPIVVHFFDQYLKPAGTNIQ